MTSNASCWFYQHEGAWGIQAAKTWKPCGKKASADNVLPCCQQDDMCLEDLLCYNPNESTRGAGTTGYYVAGCTDESYESIYCNKNCITWYATSVVQPVGSTLWNCCGTVNQTYLAPEDCANPTNETFNAPSPAELIAKGAVTYPMTTVTSSSAAPTHSATSTGGSNSTSNSASNGGSSLSAGAAAGIGIGVAIGIILLAAVAFFGWRQRRQRKQTDDSKLEPTQPATLTEKPGERHEMGLDKRRSIRDMRELPSQDRVELAGE